MSDRAGREGSGISLIVRSGRFKGQRFPVFSGMVLGRGEQADVYLPDFKASRKHAVIESAGEGAFQLRDLESHNGTFVNGERVDRVGLSLGDVIHIGTTRVDFIRAEDDDDAIIASFTASAPGMLPTIVKRVDSITVPTLDELPADEYLSALGIPDFEELRRQGPDAWKRILIKTRNFAIVHEISKAIGSSVQTPELLDRAIDYILKVLSADRGFVILLEAETGKRVVGVAKRAAGAAADLPLEVSHTIIDWVIRERSAVVSSDASTDGRFGEKTSILLYNIRSVLCMPMMIGKRVIGVIQLDSLGGGKGFTEDDLELTDVLASVLAVAVENARLFEAQERTITELRAAHKKLVSAQEQLVGKERMAVIGRFTSGLAHEIRNLLGPFMLADLLQAEYPDDEHIQEYATLMLEAYRRIGSLVDEIRMMARGEKPHLDLARRNLKQTVESVVRFVRCDQEARRHRILTEVADIPEFAYDEHRIKQLLINLIRNAAQSMDDPGTITIKAMVDSTSQGMVRIEVVDQGRGIPVELLDKIWEPFFSTSEETSSGLGLDMCRTVVERHGGRIYCETGIGVGTTMTVLLPMTEPPG